MEIASGDSAAGACGQRLRMKRGVGQKRVTPRQLMGGRRVERIGLRHGAGGFIGCGKIIFGELGLPYLAAHLRDRLGDAPAYLLGRIGREGAAKVFDDVKTVSAARDPEAHYIEGRVE